MKHPAAIFLGENSLLRWGFAQCLSPFVVNFEKKFIDLGGKSVFELHGREAHLPTGDTVRVRVNHWGLFVAISHKD